MMLRTIYVHWPSRSIRFSHHNRTFESASIASTKRLWRYLNQNRLKWAMTYCNDYTQSHGYTEVLRGCSGCGDLRIDAGCGSADCRLEVCG